MKKKSSSEAGINRLATEHKERKKQSAGTALVRPGDINDAIDSEDLLSRLMTVNIERITEKVDERIVQDWLFKRRKELRSQYIDKARAAYTKMWGICESKKLGHHWIRIDAGGVSINQCDDCKFCSHVTPRSQYNAYEHQSESRRADSLNNDLIKSLADRMIDVDIDAGLFTWPTTEDYPGTPDIDKNYEKKRKWIFG